MRRPTALIHDDLFKQACPPLQYLLLRLYLEQMLQGKGCEWGCLMRPAQRFLFLLFCRV